MFKKLQKAKKVWENILTDIRNGSMGGEQVVHVEKAGDNTITFYMRYCVEKPKPKTDEDE